MAAKSQSSSSAEGLSSKKQEIYVIMPDVISYTLIRAKRRTVSLSVDAGGNAVVRAPRRMRKEDIDAFVEKNAAWVARQRERQRLRAERFPPLDESGIEALRKRAKAELPKRVEHYAGIMDLWPTGIKITSAKKRFGSCSAKNSLCFSLYLMRYPADAIDYVVVHELAHIAHKNHGPQFYALVESVLPDYRARRALLKAD